MKKSWLILILIFLASGGMNAQAVQDSGASKKERSGDKMRQHQVKDVNADGIDDALQQKGKKFKNKKDKFIDQDGDGICDGRASGLGWRLGTKGSLRQGGGKKGPGGRQ